MSTVNDGRPGQSGQMLVVVAGGMLAMLLMLALIVVSGQLFWNQRNLQAMSDAVALAGAQQIPGAACNDTPPLNQSQAKSVIQNAVQVVYGQLGNPSSTSSVSGSCYGGYTEVFTFTGGYTLTTTYPYQGFNTLFESSMSQTSPLLFSGITGNANGTVHARAVALHNGGSANGSFAIFSRNQLSCNGSTTVTIYGDIYANQGISLTNGCQLVAKAVVSGGTYQAYGNIEVYADPPAGPNGSWGNIQADGFELQGHTDPQCGTTQYNDPNQNVVTANGQIINPNPCNPGPPPPVPNYQPPTYPDPNISPPYSPSSPDCSPTADYGSGPAPITVSGITEYQPGCYSSLTITQSQALLAPGLYYFNAVGDSPSKCKSSLNACEGLTVPDGNRLYGSDVTLEFTGQASMIAMHTLTSSCGSLCGFGGDPTGSTSGANPITVDGITYSYLAAPTASSSWCTGSCPDAGLLAYAGPTSVPTVSAGSTGEFATQGLHTANWMLGTVDFSNGTCTYQANAENVLLGQLICNSTNIQGGEASGAKSVQYSSATTNPGRVEASLVQ